MQASPNCGEEAVGVSETGTNDPEIGYQDAKTRPSCRPSSRVTISTLRWPTNDSKGFVIFPNAFILMIHFSPGHL